MLQTTQLPQFQKKPTFVGSRPAGRGAGLPICAVELSWAGATGSEIHLSKSLCDLSMVGQSFKDIYPGYFYTVAGNLMVTNRLVKTIKQQLKQNKSDNCAFGRESPFPGIHVPSWKFNSRIPNISSMFTN